MTNSFRIERDSMGELQVPADALWGAQTQRAVQNFPISGYRLPRAFIRALGLIKQAAARANTRLQLLETQVSRAIEGAAVDVASGQHDSQFPIDVYQTGSGTSTNMNANEVIASLASRRLGKPARSAFGVPGRHHGMHGRRRQRRKQTLPAGEGTSGGRPSGDAGCAREEVNR